MTTTLCIEHPISDYDMWKEAFDRDPANRKQSGVRGYAIRRPVNDPQFVMIDLDFDSVSDAEAMLTRLQEVWQSPAVTPALTRHPQTRIVETVETAVL